jgi:hypothetical protein
MSDDPKSTPIPTLSYYQAQTSGPFRLLARLVVAAAAMGALVIFVDTMASAPSEIAGALMAGSTNLQEYLLGIALLCRRFSWQRQSSYSA